MRCDAGAACVLLLLLPILTPRALLALPGVTPDCIPPGSTDPPVQDELGSPAHHLWVYVQSDLGYKMRAKTPSAADDTLTQNQVTHAIMQAAEIWNTQSRHIALVYGGPVIASTAAEFCSKTSQRPAIFVRYVDGPDVANNAVASVREATPCGERLMTFWGQDQDLTWRDFPLGSQGTTFVNSLVHEFGHGVGLGHAHEASIPTCMSVMAYKSCDATSDSGGRHLKNYEKDCVAWAFTHGREVKTRVRGLSSTGNFGGFYLLAHGQGKSFQHGPPLRTSTQFGFLFYADTGSRWTVAGADGLLSWTSWADIGAPALDIFYLDEPPSLMGIQDHGWTAATNGTRVFFLDDEHDTNGTMYNPPYVQYVRSDTTLSASSGDSSLRKCSSSCNADPELRSHLPVAAAWDPIRGVTLFGRVATQSVEGGNDGDGRIELYPGFFSASNYDRLRGAGSAFVPGSYASSSWPSDASTDQPIAIACGDNTWPDSYNCMVAWTNKDAYSGNVEYQFFRVSATYAIEFKSASSFAVRQGSSTAGGPALAFIGGDFWLAYKDIAQTTITYQRSSAPYSWWTAGYDGGHFPIVEGPAFAFKHGGEAALHFSISE